MRPHLFAALWAGCSTLPVSALIKAPVDRQCQDLGLEGCPLLVDGVILYAEGDRPAALEKLKQARAANTPENLKRFAGALSAISGVPPELSAPLTEVAALLTAEDGTASPARNSSTGDSQRATVSNAPRMDPDLSERTRAHARSTRDIELVTRALSAPIDPGRMHTESVTFSASAELTACRPIELDAVCIKRVQGPIVVTDLTAILGCPDRVFVGATDSDSVEFGFRWLVEVGQMPITGARLLVRGGEWLHVALIPGRKGFSQSPQCAVTWAGFRPRLVPQNWRADPGDAPF
jgi:hypothetical protein